MSRYDFRTQSAYNLLQQGRNLPTYTHHHRGSGAAPSPEKTREITVEYDDGMEDHSLAGNRLNAVVKGTTAMRQYLDMTPVYTVSGKRRVWIWNLGEGRKLRLAPADDSLALRGSAL